MKEDTGNMTILVGILGNIQIRRRIGKDLREHDNTHSWKILREILRNGGSSQNSAVEMYNAASQVARVVLLESSSCLGNDCAVKKGLQLVHRPPLD